MGKIRELSPLMTNQIAAGEVIEQPSSVVKELVENAIDANSTRIDIEIVDGGLEKIQVVDNGDGIESDDIELAFQRHATSKLYSQEELFRIKTLGFRGEALPSIASVSKVSVETAAKGFNEGMRVVLEGGKVISKQMAPAKRGTTMTIEQLFYNTPARLKFIRSLPRETAAIIDLVNRLALSHPSIAFSLTSDGNTLFKTSGKGDLLQTIAHVYQPKVARQMIEVTAEDLDFRVKGYVSLPELTRASRKYISLFINGRYIKNYAISQAIIDGYESKLMVKRFPIAIIMIEMDAGLVDVNVHPTKQQVRISQENVLGQLVSQSISKVMNNQVRIPTSVPKRFKEESQSVTLDLRRKEASDLLNEQNRENSPLVSTQEEKGVYPLSEDSLLNGRTSDVFEKSSVLVHTGKSERVVVEQETAVSANERTDSSQKTIVNTNNTANILVSKSVNTRESNSLVTPQQTASNGFPMLYYIGQLHGTYLLFENEDGLYMIDQHAAQERIKYEYFRVAIGQVGTQLQTLLIPIVLDYTLDEFLLIQERQQVLEAIGIHLEVFGQTSFALNSYPAWIDSDLVEESVKELIDKVLEQGSVSIESFREETAIMMSCKRSIKANHHLNATQAQALVDQLALCHNPYNCPHGRPVLVHLTQTDLEKMFKRIQDR